MARKLTRTQVLENRAFLKALARSGNVRLACRELGLKYGTMQHRRSRHAHFASAWDAALVLAQAALAKQEAKEGHHSAVLLRRQEPSPSLSGEQKSASRDRAPAFAGERAGSRHRTVAGEPVVVRLASGALQVRRAQPGKLTREAEQAFLAALSATCNVRLAAAAVGAAEAAFYRRKRKDPAFAREMRLALQAGYDRLEAALLESGLAGSHEHDEWRSNEPPAIPPMSVNQALQLMYLHQKEARLISEPDHIRRRPRESDEAYSFRLSAMYQERLRRDREDFAVAEAERMARGEPAWGPAGEAVRRELADDPSIRPCGATQDERGGFGLPDLAQVTGWSTADPAKVAHDPDRALFGGWRIEEMEAKLEGKRQGRSRE